jgi:hypothetical protein
MFGEPKSTDRWYELGGIVAAYQPVAAPSSIDARQNVGRGRLGTFTATPGVAPTWSPATGWTFNGTQYLSTGIVPQLGYSMLGRFSNGVALAPNALCGCSDTGGAWRFYLRPFMAAGTHRYGYGNGVLTPSGGLISGVMGLAGTNGYLNGILEGTAGTWVNATLPVYIGAEYSTLGPTVGNFWIGNGLSIAIYSRTLSAAEMWQASLQMKYCDANPDFNAWAPRRRWFIAPGAAGRVGIYGVRPTIALPGGVRIWPGDGGAV